MQISLCVLFRKHFMYKTITKPMRKINKHLYHKLFQCNKYTSKGGKC